MKRTWMLLFAAALSVGLVFQPSLPANIRSSIQESNILNHRFALRCAFSWQLGRLSLEDSKAR